MVVCFDNRGLDTISRCSLTTTIIDSQRQHRAPRTSVRASASASAYEVPRDAHRPLGPLLQQRRPTRCLGCRLLPQTGRNGARTRGQNPVASPGSAPAAVFRARSVAAVLSACLGGCCAGAGPRGNAAPQRGVDGDLQLTELPPGTLACATPGLCFCMAVGARRQCA
jgi:hypothetical protein